VYIRETALIGQITNTGLLPIAVLFQTTAKSEWERKRDKVYEK
jgi:hypothetical protein